MNRKKKLMLNTISSLIFLFTNFICAFILQKFILKTYGSEVNGLVESITQFLGAVTLLDMGVGAVVQSSLYKPLAENDSKMISRIFVSAGKFFRKIALILLIYVIALMCFYPFSVNKSFGILYTVLLIGSMCVSSFAQYYFGVVNGLLLTADQKGYIQYTSKSVTLVINTLACVVLIQLGCSIHIVKLTTSLIFLLRPTYLQRYVKKHYSIDRKITYSEEPIKQKWNGMAQHFASFVLTGTDSIVLTLFSSLSNVSVYSVYNMVCIGMKNIVISFTNGMQSLIGEMLAKKEMDKLKKFFDYIEWLIHTVTALVFGCTGILLLNFIRVYTKGITDINYIHPLFAVLITAANAGHCFRLPYNIIILAAGHYKQTQSNYIIAMIMNIFISVVTVNFFGLVGVAAGTLAAMTYQTVWMSRYNSKHILHIDFKSFLKHIAIDMISVVISVIITFKIPMLSVSYLSFFILAFEVLICWIAVSLIINYIFYKEYIIRIFEKAKRRS